MERENPRQIAVRVLKRHTEARSRGEVRGARAGKSGFIENLLDREGQGLSAADRGLAQELTYGVVRWQATLDWLIGRKTGRRTQKLTLQVLLRLGLYQLFWLERVPDHAAVNETVELARQMGFGPQAGFINAILRGYIRERDETRRLLGDLKVAQPALGYSHPEWLVERWKLRWGEPALRQLLEWNNTPPPTYARLNTLRTDREGLLTHWEKEGIVAKPCEFDWTTGSSHNVGGEVIPMFHLESFPPLATLPSFQAGLFYIQDPSTLLPVLALMPQAGERVLDLCAAPGGKTTLLAQLMHDQGLILAQDPQPARLELIRENCARLGVTCVRIEDTGERPEARGEKFRRILIDAPCSNTGVLRRRVDARWRITPEELARLTGTQSELLQSAARQLEPGGALVYSTCSIEAAENEDVVRAFLEKHAEFRLDFERTLLPFKERVDGAYVARLLKQPTSGGN